MISFLHPWLLLLLLLLPLLAWWRKKRQRHAAFLYSSTDLMREIVDLRRSRTTGASSLLRWLALALCIVALARPRLEEGETSVTASGVDIIVALDLSSSMSAMDFVLDGKPCNRLTAAKDVLEQFIERRRNDRIGLVAFSGQAYIAGPLTLDHSFLRHNLERLTLHLIEDGTAIGSAITAGLNRLRDLESKSRILILMTDGENNAGEVPPLTAAEAAEALGVKIYTIGVGTHGVAPIPTRDPFTGRQVMTRMPVSIDEKTLTEIAQKTGGKYWRADSSDTLRAIYDEIDQLEKTEIEIKEFRFYHELILWLLLPAFGLLLLEVVLHHTLWRRLP